MKKTSLEITHSNPKYHLAIAKGDIHCTQLDGQSTQILSSSCRIRRANWCLLPTPDILLIFSFTATTKIMASHHRFTGWARAHRHREHDTRLKRTSRWRRPCTGPRSPYLHRSWPPHPGSCRPTAPEILLSHAKNPPHNPPKPEQEQESPVPEKKPWPEAIPPSRESRGSPANTHREEKNPSNPIGSHAPDERGGGDTGRPNLAS